MDRRLRFFLFAIAFVLSLSFLWLNRKSTEKVSPTNVSIPLPKTIAEESSETPQETPQTVQQKQSPLKKTIRSFPKNLTSQYEESLKKDPHQPPLNLIPSALELGKIFDLVRSEDEARTAFDFFNQCVTQEKVVAIQTACFRYARQLSQKYKTLESEFQKLRMNTSEDVLRVVQVDGP